MGYEQLFLFAGGLGMFIYGMQIMSQGLENAAGNKMKSLLEVLTKNKLMGVALGALITAVIQSSSATTVMVVGFVNAGIMNLTQAMGVIMGANIGTTMTAWIVSMGEWASFLKPSTLAPVAIAIGVVVMMVGKRRATKDVASIVVGFGLLFVGIDNMSSAMSGLKEVPAFTQLFVSLGSNPILGILVGAGVTAVIQSSSASVGILQSLAVAGLIPFNSAVYIIMGQNIGTCVTAMLSSMGAKKNAKTAALMHLLFNIIGTVIFSVASIAFFQIVNPSWGRDMITATQISTVHTAFNIATTLLLFPASNLIIKLAKKIGRVNEEEQDDRVVSLDDRMLQTPTIALQATMREVGRMGDLVKDTLDVARRVLFTKTKEDIRLLRDDEDKVDKMCAAISDYVIKLTRLQISDREHENVTRMLQVVSDIERVGDYCENISEFAEEMSEKKLSFSDIGTNELKEMIEVCADCYEYAIQAFMENDKEKALKVIENEIRADELEVQLRTKHIKRLTNQECNTEAGIVFLDTVICLERISDHARNIAEEVLGTEMDDE
ncbi:MAG: Na/Pi cotransporter family protein [Tyzzerella sp.]|nr:Na/Pi cotransporter family protein [Tyzzerella sp.]